MLKLTNQVAQPDHFTRIKFEESLVNRSPRKDREGVKT